MKEIKCCEVCGNKNLSEVLNLGNHPLCDDLIEFNSKKISEKYPINLLFCKDCKTVLHKWEVDKEILFTKNYHYRAHVTKSVVNSLEQFFISIKEFANLSSSSQILDIGCNDGSLLNFFKDFGCKTYGIDPCDGINLAKINGHTTIQEYFTPIVARRLKDKEISPDIITFTNSFAHIEDLNSLCKSIKIISKRKTLIVIENHYLGSILKANHFDTFYHEHPRTYSIKSFLYIAKKLSLDVLKIEFPARDGGNIRVFLGDKNLYKNHFNYRIYKEDDFFESLSRMQNKINNWKINCNLLIDNLIKINDNKPLIAKAFPGRATILINLLGLDEKKIKVVYEIKGSIKTGYYVPGTRIPIKPEKELYSNENPKLILNLAWHISKAVRNNLTRNNINSEVYDIVEDYMMQ